MHIHNSKNKEYVLRGFTLIELLVAVTIFIILTALTVGAFNLNIGSERTKSTSRMLQAKFEGARSRAYGASIQDGKGVPYGIRFILDEFNPGLATGFQFVRGFDEVPTGRLHFVDLTPGDGIPDNNPGIQELGARDINSQSFLELANLGLLRGGLEIVIDEVPYIISSSRFLSNTYNNTTLELIPNPRGVSNYGDPSSPNSPVIGERAEYQLDLSTVAVPVPGEDIQSFPNGSVVDLRFSDVPADWRKIFPWVAGRLYQANDWIIVRKSSGGLKYCQAITGGTSGGSQPNFEGAALFSVVNDGGLSWRVYDSLHLDLMFSPQGNVFGPTSAQGVLHFLIASRGDIDDGLRLDDSAAIPQLRGSYRVVTVYTNSGSVSVSEADLTDIDGVNGVDDLFNYARQGLSANK
ncbi:type II secretion system protein [Rubinisphaera sp.]|uniref:pilus assembly FimT family protein n=1 Tax=Rubinisphaera sp. TaxID=2024857 RepID=UPI000C0D4BD4|nr:type II secretion system protein [Rubinisphaera sp.]MBV11945.1 hypothetical protein [Rubinisphaera sp.]HCS55210.1 hypothetical protein [Planctomycetaceae bacterium]|tara:strand:+ start:10676 stop:11896 length:1221 start_codon:yes stop_codon:yes gene_type:complete